MVRLLDRNIRIATAIACTLALLISVLGQGCSRVRLKNSPPPPTYKRVHLKVAYCPEAGASLRTFYARNFSAVAKDFGFEADSDHDGLPDSFEDDIQASAFASSKNSKDSNGDGYSDFVMVKAGYRAATQASLAFCPDANSDLDNDGLSDCDESVLHTLENNPDTDGDGIPDYWEVYYGLNPMDPFDAEQDTDSDGVINVAEVQKGTPIGTTNDPDHDNITYQLSASYHSDLPAGCQFLRANNIPILEIAADNLLRMDIVEIDSKGISSIKSVEVIVAPTVLAETVYEAKVNIQ